MASGCRHGPSAGGLEALRALLAALPPNSGMAFVLIQHLDPLHDSLMAGLLSSHTTMPVTPAAEGVAIERTTSISFRRAFRSLAPGESCIFPNPPSAMAHGCHSIFFCCLWRKIAATTLFALCCLAQERMEGSWLSAAKAGPHCPAVSEKTRAGE